MVDDASVVAVRFGVSEADVRAETSEVFLYIASSLHSPP